MRQYKKGEKSSVPLVHGLPWWLPVASGVAAWAVGRFPGWAGDGCGGGKALGGRVCAGQQAWSWVLALVVGGRIWSSRRDLGVHGKCLILVRPTLMAAAPSAFSVTTQPLLLVAPHPVAPSSVAQMPPPLCLGCRTGSLTGFLFPKGRGGCQEADGEPRHQVQAPQASAGAH